jgi:hypothetical protein
LPKAQEVPAQGTACTEGALEAPVLQHLSEAKTQKEPERKARRLEYQQNRLAAAGEIVLNQVTAILFRIAPDPTTILNECLSPS